MKRIAYSILLFLILCTYNVKSQTYYPLVADSVHWFIALDNGVFGAGTYSSIFEYYSIGDTIVNSNTYKKVYKRDIQSLNSNYQAPYQPLTPYTLFGIIREDTTSKKVYTIVYQNAPGCSTGQEELLYDFDINGGDSINDDMCIATQPHPEPLITAIANITIFGYSTVRYIRSGFTTTSYYEGIGTDKGLFEWEASEYYVLWDYCIGSDINCGLTTGIFESKSFKLFKIFPNPVESILNIRLFQESKFKPIVVTITDVFGKKILTKDMINYVSNIDLSSLKKGVYFFKIQDLHQETLHFTKLIKL